MDISRARYSSCDTDKKLSKMKNVKARPILALNREAFRFFGVRSLTREKKILRASLTGVCTRDQRREIIERCCVSPVWYGVSHLFYLHLSNRLPGEWSICSLFGISFAVARGTRTLFSSSTDSRKLRFRSARLTATMLWNNLWRMRTPPLFRFVFTRS